MIEIFYFEIFISVKDKIKVKTAQYQYTTVRKTFKSQYYILYTESVVKA